MAKAMELATANVAHIKGKEADEVNKICAESNAFKLQKKKMCFGAVENSTRDAQCPAFKCNNKNIFPDIVKINKEETCRITFKRHTVCSYCLQDTVTINHVCVNLN